MTKAKPRNAANPESCRKRTKQIALRVSESKYAAFRKVADDLDLPLTTWIRLVCRRAAGMETP